MAVAFVQSKSADGGSVTSAPLAFTSNVAAGSLIVVAARISANGRTVTVTDNHSGSYAAAFTTIGDGLGDDLACYYAMNAAGGATTVTVAISGAAASIRLAIHEYSGVATASALDQGSRQTFSGTTTPASPSVTTGNANELLFGVVDNGGSTAASSTAGASYTQREMLVLGGLLKIATEDQIVSATGAYTAGFTLNASDGGAVGIATFKASSASSTPKTLSASQGQSPAAVKQVAKTLVA